MPRQVDHDERRRSIARAARRVLTREGPSGLTMRALAQELGGSLTLVTHYYPTRTDLLADIPVQLAADWREELAALEATSTDPMARLRTLLEWLMPTTDEGLEDEQVRFALLADRNDAESAAILVHFDRVVRELLRNHVVGLVASDVVDITVDLLRAFTNGVVLDTVMDPDGWPAQRQLDLLDQLLFRVLTKAGEQQAV